MSLKTERISTQEAAARKGCTPHAIRYAIHQDYLDAEQYGKVYVVITNRKFDAWTPNRNIQNAVKSRKKN